MVAAEPRIALDQENVAGLQRVADDLGVGRVKRRIAAGRLCQIFEDFGAEIGLDLVEHEPQSCLRTEVFARQVLAFSQPCPVYAQTRAVTHAKL